RWRWPMRVTPGRSARTMSLPRAGCATAERRWRDDRLRFRMDGRTPLVCRRHHRRYDPVRRPVRHHSGGGAVTGFRWFSEHVSDCLALPAGEALTALAKL